jgi:hypothetical protein
VIKSESNTESTSPFLPRGLTTNLFCNIVAGVSSPAVEEGCHDASNSLRA